MTKLFQQNKNIILVTVLVLFMLCGIFYFFMVRPLAIQEENMKQELNRINEDAVFYQESIHHLLPQTFSEKEAETLVGSIPIQPNVEEIIKDLERTELETGTVIDHIAVSIHPNEWNGTPEADDQTIELQDLGLWGHLFPSELSDKLQDKLTEVKDLRVSYVEMAINLNGNQEDMNKFVQKLENLQRIIHVQGFDYSINEERENRLEGIVTIRAFYSEEFANLIYDDQEFELDYQFDPEKIKRYIDKEAPPVNSESAESAGSNPVENSTNTDKPSTNDGLSNTGSTSNNEPPNQSGKVTTPPSIGSKPGLDYYGPEMKVEKIQPGDPVFHIVQTGAYTSSNYLFSAAQSLMEIGVNPRIIGDRLSYIYTATDSTVSSAKKIVDLLKDQGFDSYVKTLPYRLTADDKNMLLTEAEDAVSSITVILTSGITEPASAIKEEQYNHAAAKMKTYQMKVEQYLKNSSNDGRNHELEETVRLLDQIDELLLEYRNNEKKETLWEAEALILDFLLIFNSYVPVNVKD